MSPTLATINGPPGWLTVGLPLQLLAAKPHTGITMLPGNVMLPSVAHRSMATVLCASAGRGNPATASSSAKTEIQNVCLVNLVILIAPYCGQVLGNGGSTRVKVAGPVIGTPHESNWKSA